MEIYKVNEDGVSVSTLAHRPGQEIPEGWTSVPTTLECKVLWYVDGVLTDIKPDSMVAADELRREQEEKIEKKMREIAIKELIKSGDLPPDYIDKEK